MASADAAAVVASVSRQCSVISCPRASVIEEDLHSSGRSQAKALKFASVDGHRFNSADITWYKKLLAILMFASVKH